MTSRRRFLAAAALAFAPMLLSKAKAAEPQQHPPREKAMDPGPLRPQWTNVKGLRMYALVSVEAAPPRAPAIVLVHGSGLSHQYMIPVARELTRDFRVYVPDQPGYGNSGDPGAVLKVPELADWLAAWMEAIGLPRASFLGNSFGCQVIADHAARYPGQVDSAILQGPTTPPEERSGFWQFVRWRQNQPYNPEWLGDVTMVDYRKAGLWRLLRSFQIQITDRIENKVPAIRAPVLVVRGEHDPITRPEFAQMLVRLAPRGKLHVIPHVAHTLCTTAPVELAEATRAFVRAAVSREGARQ